MSTITESVNVTVPIRVAYDQWTQFEEFPRFMEGVEEVRQVDDTTLRWTVRVAGVTRRFAARITEQLPDERVAWTSTEGPAHAGVVTFHRLDDDTTRVTAQMEFDPEGLVEKAGDRAGTLHRRVKDDLRRFKTFIESRGVQTGGWRGKVDRPGS
ncbi:SRPBCC family protein [Actinomadura verrucosospora]|uniref:Polyketide cyclase / dehydrase family protein n=1 Tax=Actinomadura verrucosospora TaxID=46165 RepID=A0A7D3VU23_ACTVE|nr:SRPBCC family protein [Actinomadura verrucosospora]QKG18872.1 polyketide cyclase / dehydrase family protein [Actinomadura verrucosospora]